MNIIQTNFTYRSALNKLDPAKVDYVILHHAGAVTASAEDIHNWHLERYDIDKFGNKKYWNGFGYNEYIRKNGDVYIGRGDNIGAHCRNYNSKSYGICCEGDYSIERSMPELQFSSLIERIRYHLNRFKLEPDNIKFHQQLNSTECPGVYFSGMSSIRNLCTKNINFIFNGKSVELPYISQNDFTYVKLREICALFEAKLEYNSDTNTIMISKG